MKAETESILNGLKKGEQKQISREDAERLIDRMFKDRSISNSYVIIEDNGPAGKEYFITKIL